MLIDALAGRGETVLVVHGTFNRQDLAALERAIAEAGRGARVRVDLHEARNCDDAAIAMLARGLQGSAGDVEVVGLSDHHHRLLRYMGVGLRGARH
jgi:hypothetical protein